MCKTNNINFFSYIGSKINQEPNPLPPSSPKSYQFFKILVLF